MNKCNLKNVNKKFSELLSCIARSNTVKCLLCILCVLSECYMCAAACRCKRSGRGVTCGFEPPMWELENKCESFGRTARTLSISPVLLKCLLLVTSFHVIYLLLVCVYMSGGKRNLQDWVLSLHHEGSWGWTRVGSSGLTASLPNQGISWFLPCANIMPAFFCFAFWDNSLSVALDVLELPI